MERILEPEAMDTLEDTNDYDQMDHSVPNAAFTQRLVDLGAHGKMLDIGTGPGHIPVLVCDRIPHATVIGIDLSGHMLAIAERRKDGSPHRERLEFRLADAKIVPFADHAFDTVFSNTILHHIPDPRPFLREAWRVLRPGGAFLIRDLYRPENEIRLAELVAQHTVGATPPQRELFRASLHGAFTPDEIRALLQEIGLNELEVTVDTDRHMSIQKRAEPSAK